MPERKKLPLIPAESLCSSCTGACCRRGTTMKLTHTEAAFFEASGVDLTRTDLSSSSVNDAEPEHYYYLWQDCSFLKQVGSAAICSIYEDERRPKVCSNFEQGSRACLGMRDPGYTAPRRPPSESDFMM